MRDLRISVTDRCNLRCRYCMPAERFGRDHRFLPDDAVLTDDEIVRLAGIFVGLGTHKLRITGGEPLLRAGLPQLVARLTSRLPADGDLALTTNGTLLQKLAPRLRDAGLHRVTISLDALDPDIFSRLGGTSLEPKRVLAGINAALSAGLGVKINTVVKRDVNESQVVPLAKLAHDLHVPIRFIEFMDVGTTNGWNHHHVVPSAELIARLAEHFDLAKVHQPDLSETARRYHHTEAPESAEVGFISSVSEPFCRDCTRARLSADGKFFTCLFASGGHDLRSLLRIGADDAALTRTITGIWNARGDRYSEQRAHATPGDRHDKPEMSYIGG
ncbi:GTP 3',8-cyclase MoaA [Sulfuriroseicoccus oceanibius]|uniref:GTP 3',8-cyclase n=2 Tax=Sulfuriroseicoccus oceanibius TaxID=2707525 RepID=A0A6B3LDK8_9BACT|nr:GTP 3',8-cyclase MoaA [Sulfuriroseicoccus oceanibius]